MISMILALVDNIVVFMCVRSMAHHLHIPDINLAICFAVRATISAFTYTLIFKQGGMLISQNDSNDMVSGWVLNFVIFWREGFSLAVAVTSQPQVFAKNVQMHRMVPEWYCTLFYDQN